MRRALITFFKYISSIIAFISRQQAINLPLDSWKIFILQSDLIGNKEIGGRQY